jgi:hypothetical protein
MKYKMSLVWISNTTEERSSEPDVQHLGTPCGRSRAAMLRTWHRLLKVAAAELMDNVHAIESRLRNLDNGSWRSKTSMETTTTKGWDRSVSTLRANDEINQADQMRRVRW